MRIWDKLYKYKNLKKDMKILPEYKKDKTFVYLVRHGDREKVPHDKIKEMFSKDLENNLGLSQLGKKQAKELANRFSRIKIDLFISSNIKRAIETAEEVAKKIKKNLIIYSEFNEINRIIFSKKYYHYKFWKHFFKYKKMINKFDEILDKNKGKVILIIAHGNVIKSILKNKLNISAKQADSFDYHNCHVSLLRFNNKKLDYIHYFNSKDFDDLL